MIDMVAPNQLPKLIEPKVSVPTPTASDASFDKPGLMRKVTRTSPNRGVGLPLWANRIATQFYFPTPVASDWKNGRPGDGYGPNLPQAATNLMPTPKALDGVKGNLKTSQERLDSGHQVDLPNVAIDLLGTPRANAANSSSKQVELGAPKSRLEDQVHTGWGKFEPAIRRWEAILDRPAPEPTKPDGKEGNHRLSSKFTEWMMGLPDGWITDIGLKRNDELKACGNGVVPQQAELALSLLGIKELLS
jgi:DNA (cytosine-5)-methyltransferase 1